MQTRFLIYSLIITVNVYGQSFKFNDGDKIYSCAHVLDEITGQIDAYPCSSLKLILKRDAENEFIILSNDNEVIHYKIIENFYIDDVQHFRTLSDNGIKTVFSIQEENNGIMHNIDVSFYSESNEEQFSYKMKVFHYSIYDSIEEERIKNLKTKIYDLKEIDEKKWFEMLHSLQYNYFNYFEFTSEPKFDKKDKTKDYILIDNLYKIRVTGDFRRSSIKTEIDLLKGEEFPELRSCVYFDEIPYVQTQEGVGVYPEVNFPEVPVQFVQGVTVLRINWSEDIVEIIRRPPPTGLDIEQALIEQIKADHNRGHTLPKGTISIFYTYVSVLNQYKIKYQGF